MKVIGITGGAGAGKSAILSYVEDNYRARVLYADAIATELMQPGSRCFEELQQILPQEVYTPEGELDRKALAELMFSEESVRKDVNAIVHPAVKVYIIDTIGKERERGSLDYLLIEAALLIEDHYEEICDALWYVYASQDIRRERLKEGRGYSDEKITGIFASQLSESAYRRACQVVIDNNGMKENAIRQVLEALGIGRENMVKGIAEEKLVFGLDIGTRNVVGTVGCLEEDGFYVMAQYVKEHETRSMLDGQIHDIGRVGRTINVVKQQLEAQLGTTLSEVCIAAAGRVLKTVNTTVECEFEEETVVDGEHIHTLDLLGIERAQEILNEQNDTKFRFYCVGYSVVKYYLNDDPFSNLEGHKADKIGEDIIVTFLPEDVVDGLYSAVAHAGLKVANLTLEPIAAINVAIPEAFRMLNIALVDVGAGTSDISITNEGSIIAYGMIPCAGDEITELIVQHYLVDFKMAEHIKLASTVDDEIEFTDIMSLKHTIPSSEIWELVAPVVDRLATDVASRIRELNGDKTVSATFVVGGGGKVHGFIEKLAKELELPQERVALRGEEVLREVHFSQPEIKKDPLLVTPIGICLNYYEQKNNFIIVRFNGERIKLYDNSKLTIVDAALAAGFPNEQLFPRRGQEINFTVDGRSRIARGEAGESAIIKVNGHVVSMNTPLEANSDITIQPSTVGDAAAIRLEDLEEYRESTISFWVNHHLVNCPRFFEVNGSLEPPYYEIQEGDQIETRSFYTVSQIAEFMDVELDLDREIFVNNRVAELETLVYENFSIDWTVIAYRTLEAEIRAEQGRERPLAPEAEQSEMLPAEQGQLRVMGHMSAPSPTGAGEQPEGEANGQLPEPAGDTEEAGGVLALNVQVNEEPVILTGKESYIFVDVFNYVDFDLSAGQGRKIVTLLNGETAGYTQEIHEGDRIELYWQE